MAALYIILTLLIQNSLADTLSENESESLDILKPNLDIVDTNVNDFEATPDDWMDAFIGSGNNIFPSSSAALMAQATSSNKSPEEQLEDIKEMATQITNAIQSEMANLLSYAIACTSKEETDNKLRKKRSLETPMDSSQLVMRLLKHIKSNNEYQNIAIENMMTAQEIADKYGISFTPDPDTLSDLAVAANEQAKEMSEILKDACELKNITQNDLQRTQKDQENAFDNKQVKSQNYITFDMQSENSQHNASLNIPEQTFINDNGYDRPVSYYSYHYDLPVESQIESPTSQQCTAPVSQKPNFYDFISYNPNQDFLPYCSMEPMMTSTSFILPFDEAICAEPELVAEEYEETISSKVYIEHEEEPGLSTVNHVMSYTVSEKAHFKTPEIESLPQQMQYYFLLM